jgi:hypothetical protein
MRSLPPQTFVLAIEEPPDVNIPLVVEDHEPEPWSMGAIARRTSELESQLVQAIRLAGGLPPTKSTQIALASKASRAAEAIK